MKKKVKMMPKINGWVIVNAFGCLPSFKCESKDFEVYGTKKAAAKDIADYSYPERWRIARVEIRELHSPKKKR